jgi:glutathione S-transferase
MSVKISYFNARGYAEPIRWILSHAGVDFEDIRVPLESLPVVLPPEIKEKCRWGQVPLAEFDGKTLAQSLAITRYFARKYNLVPKDDYEAALCDEFVDTIREFVTAWFAVKSESDPAKKEEKKAEQLKIGKQKHLDVFEKIIQANGGTHLVGSSFTWADLNLAHAINHVQLGNEVQLLTPDLPGVKNLYDYVLSTPGIKAWIEKRPDTKF